MQRGERATQATQGRAAASSAATMRFHRTDKASA